MGGSVLQPDAYHQGCSAGGQDVRAPTSHEARRWGAVLVRGGGALRLGLAERQDAGQNSIKSKLGAYRDGRSGVQVPGCRQLELAAHHLARHAGNGALRH